MFTYKLENGSWLASVKGRSFTAQQLLDFIRVYFADLKLAEGDSYKRIFSDVYQNVLQYSTYVNYAKNKSGQMEPSPDFYRSFVTIAMDNAQSAAFCLAERYAKQKGVTDKVVEKFATAVHSNFYAYLEGKPLKDVPEVE